MRSEKSRPLGETVRSALLAATGWLATAGIDDSALEAELLLAHTLGLTRTQLFTSLDAPQTTTQLNAFDTLLKRRLAREPLGYISGHREFFGIDLLCTPAALIPRPETELLVDLALGYLERHPQASVVDVGTGTGAIAIAIAANSPHARLLATDTSADALALAAQNARRAGVADRIDFVRGSLLEPLRSTDLIVANPPYISDAVYARLAPELHREPESALRAGPRGTELIEALLTQARGVLAAGGVLLAEHAWDQGAMLREAAVELFPNATIETKRDLAGLDRALLIAL